MLKRKTTGSIVCPNCGRLVSVNAKKCISCGKRNPGLWGYGPLVQQLLGNGSMIPPVIGASVILYVLALLIDPAAILRPQGMLELLSPSMKALDDIGMTGAYAMSQGRWWTLITAIYLHGGVLHILFNMLWLRQLGVMVEQLYGTARTFLIFTVAGAVGFYISDLAKIPFTVGASGSIFGLLGALIYYGRRRGGVFGAALYRQVGTWTIVLFAFGFLMPAVNNLAHAGGFISGVLASMLFGFQEQKRETANHRLAAIAALVLTMVCFGLAIHAWIMS
jgi:rhomboid protease GluP